MRFSVPLGAMCAVALSVGTSGQASSQENSDATRFLVMEPNARVVFITTGGAEVRADWSESAKINLRAGYSSQLEERGYSITEYDRADEPGEDLEQLFLLYEMVTQSAEISMPHKGGGIGSNYDITLGGSVSVLAESSGADYALFSDHYSQIESGGVFLTSVLIGAATGYTPPSQNVRATNGTIIDLQTGNIVDRAGAAMGDPRDESESADIVRRVMRNLSIE